MGRRHPRHLVHLQLGGAVLASTLLAASLASPSSSASKVASVKTASSRVLVRVQPIVSLMDQPVSIRITGLHPRSVVTVRLAANDAAGVAWSSEAVFQANSRGAINPATMAPSSGGYSGVEAMGLVSSMISTLGSEYYYSWQGSTNEPFRLSVWQAGRMLGSTTFDRRGNAPGVKVLNETLAGEGFVGQYWVPTGKGRRPAILDFGGGEGGLDGQPIGASLASAGYPVLDLAYFGEPGLPEQLLNIPLEYFANALKWLGDQADVNSKEIYVSGSSAGGDAALLLGVYYPTLVHGVIASSADNFVFCIDAGCTGPAWTFDGVAIPYTIPSDPQAVNHPGARIQVQDIEGPVFLDCGGDDQVSNTACDQADAIMARLGSFDDPYKHVLYDYPDAGHGVGSLVPYDPGVGSASIAGSYPEANHVADANLWPHLLAWLPKAS